jgi:hypothetical protein
MVQAERDVNGHGLRISKSCRCLTRQSSSGRSIKCERSELPQSPDCFNVR